MQMIYRSPKNPNSHLTAKRRKQPSYPTRFLLEHGYVRGKVLDFGSGLGADARYLRKLGYDVTEYDPYYAPEYPSCRFDTILCHYVLNVLLPEEQPYVLMCISELLHPYGKAYYSVRRDLSRDGYRFHQEHGVYVYQRRVYLPFKSVLQNNFCEIYEYRHYNQVIAGQGCPYCFPSLDTLLLTETEAAYSIAINPADLTQGLLVVPKRHIRHLDTEIRDECKLVVRRLRRIVNTSGEFTVMKARVCTDVHQHAHVRITF
ncbi:hypothetical protein HRbin16_02309 [bacterium HR16]|nr:hypothetical protein HRbin16_02309 [bacterium HR16]